MNETTKTTWVREWIIFALSIGLGGHVILGIVLHDPASLQGQNIGWNALLIGLIIYTLFQAGRSVFFVLRARRAKRES